ncbi:hypothetical protein B0H13DRAFT_1877297 [Mycena leptocephala]|nr:hypothetical protein B0H13DRAFT_1877297 [Mycena leptocephala]
MSRVYRKKKKYLPNDYWFSDGKLPPGWRSLLGLGVLARVLEASDPISFVTVQQPELQRAAKNKLLRRKERNTKGRPPAISAKSTLRVIVWVITQLTLNAPLDGDYGPQIYGSSASGPAEHGGKHRGTLPEGVHARIGEAGRGQEGVPVNRHGYRGNDGGNTSDDVLEPRDYGKRSLRSSTYEEFGHLNPNRPEEVKGNHLDQNGSARRCDTSLAVFERQVLGAAASPSALRKVTHPPPKKSRMPIYYNAGPHKLRNRSPWEIQCAHISFVEWAQY